MGVEQESRVVVKILKPKAEEEKPESKEAALLEALRGFVRHEARHPEKKTVEAGIRPLQAAVLLALVLDTVLLYWEFQRWFENPLVQFGLKVVPWILGATAFTYSEKARAWLLAQCWKRWLGIVAVLVLVPLVVLRQPLFSVKVRVDSDSILVSSVEAGVRPSRQEAKVFVVTLPDLSKPYQISIEDHHNDKVSQPFTLTLGRWRLARATFAQIPILGRMFGRAELPLTPLYRVYAKSAKNGYAIIEGKFQEGFFQESSLASLGCNAEKPTIPGMHSIRCSIRDERDAFQLPPGQYQFHLIRDGCDKKTTREIKEGENDTIDFDQLCAP